MPRSSPSISFTDCILLQTINSSYILTGHYADKNGINTKYFLNFGMVLQPNIFGTSGRASAGLSYGRFKANRHKFYCKLPSKEPLGIGRKGWKQLIWYGHVKSTHPPRPPTIMIHWKPEGRKKRGRPRRTWKAGIYTDMIERDLRMGEWNNRRQWNMKIGRCRQTF
jgi:hypothetical protein